MIRLGNSFSMTLRCSNGISQRGQLSPLLYNIYTNDLNHHLEATGVGCLLCIRRCLGKFTENGDDKVLLSPTVSCSSCRHFWRYGVHMLNLMILYTTQQKQSLCWPTDQSNHKVGTQQDSGSEMRNIYFVEEFRYLGHVMTADCRDDKDIVKQFRRQNAIGNMLVRKFSFASM